MEMVESTDRDVSIVCVRGRVDASTAPAFEAKLLALIDAGAQRLVIDCAELDYISSAGLRVLLVAAKRLKPVHGHLALAAIQDQIKEVLDIAGFTSLLPIYTTRKAAAHALNVR